MPMHDWTLVDAGLFHAFHHRWIDSICDELNAGVLPSDYYALPEQNIRGPIPDVIALKLTDDDSPVVGGGVAVAESPPKVRHITRSEAGLYADKASYITVRHRHGDVVTIIEIVSPGNKGSRAAFQDFVEKSTGLISAKISLLVIDLFPPTRRDPFGVHKAIWDGFDEKDFAFPRGKNRTLASCDAGPPQVAYVENVGLGDKLPEMPIFLRPEIYVNAPLESTYQSAWAAFPRVLKGLLEPPPKKKEVIRRQARNARTNLPFVD